MRLISTTPLRCKQEEQLASGLSQVTHNGEFHLISSLPVNAFYTTSACDFQNDSTNNLNKKKPTNSSKFFFRICSSQPVNDIDMTNKFKKNSLSVN